MDQSPSEEPEDAMDASDETESDTPDASGGEEIVASTAKASAGLSGIKLVLFGAVAVVAGAAGGAIFGPELIAKFSSGEIEKPGGETEPATGEDEKAKEGFSFSALPEQEAVEKISVTLMVGEGGEDLEETVDVHLGAGFPFRLSPLGGESEDSAFAAFPEKASLKPGETTIKAGESATFEFSFSGDGGGSDKLASTPQMLRDLTGGDLRAIGFSSMGKSEWILEGYRIEVNGKTFAEHDSVDAIGAELVTRARADLDAKKPESEVLLRKIADLETFIKLGLAGDTEKNELAKAQADLSRLSGPLNDLAGISSGYYPWYQESDEAFLSAVKVADPVNEIDVTLVAGGGDQPGTRNPVYLSASGKKFLLTSESDPLGNADAPQEFTISGSDLKNSPVTLDDLKKLGLGVVGNEIRFGTVPDRAKIQRLTVSADGKRIYDSEQVTGDRRALKAFWLLPPAHYDTSGEIIRNEEKEAEKHFWAMGMTAPINIVITGTPIAPEAPPVTVKPPTFLPKPPAAPGTGGTPGSLPPAPGKPPVAPGKPGTTVAGTPPTPPPAPGNPGSTGGTPPPPPPSGPGGKPNLPPAPGNPSIPGIAQPGTPPGGGTRPGGIPVPPRGPTLPPATIPGMGVGGGTFAQPGVTIATTGIPAGTFVPTGRIDPRTGLVTGTWQRGGSGGHVPIRRKFPLGGLSPTVFNQPPATGIRGGNPNRVLTAADILSIIATIKNIIKPTPPKPGPKNPIPPPTLGTVSFPNTSSAVEMGRKMTVDWTVLGGGTSAAGISSFKIDLMPVLPHLSPPIPAGSKPLVSTTAGANSRTISVPAIALPKTGTFPGITEEDLPLLYVQPRITALDAKGKTVGTAKDGPVLPLLPDPLTYQKHGARFSLKRGITKKPIDDPAAAVGGSFQLMPPAGTRDSWKALGLVKPTAGQGNVVSMIGFAEEASLSGARFAPTEVQAPFKAFNTAVRTRGGNTAVLLFEGGISYPKLGGKSVPAGKPGVLRGYRIVGNVGFLAGAVKGTGKAEVQVRVDLSGAGFRFGPDLVHKKNGDQVPDRLLMNSAYFRIETTAPIEVAKVPGGGMQEFDIPISFEALDKGIGAVYPASRPAASFGAVPKGSDFANPAKHLTAPMTKKDFSVYEFAKAQRGNYGVTITIMADTSNVSANDTLGIFGLRIVPDVY